MSRLEVGQKGGDERKEGERQGGREEKRHREERGIKKGKMIKLLLQRLIKKSFLNLQ